MPSSQLPHFSEQAFDFLEELEHREHLLEHHEQARALLAAPALARLAEPFDGRPLVRSPRGFPAEHPAADLLRVRSWALFRAAAGRRRPARRLRRRRRRAVRVLAPLVDFLNLPLATVTPLARDAAAGRRNA